MIKVNTNVTKINTAIAVLLDAKESLSRYETERFLDGGLRPKCGVNCAKEDTPEAIKRRLVVVRGLLNQINQELFKKE